VKGATDPAKNPNAKSLQYIRKELMKGKVFDRIAASGDVIARNLLLVQLPFEGPAPIDLRIVKEKFDGFDFLSVFDRMQFQHFLKEEIYAGWRRFFS
jgi:hypothetical protein